MKNAKRLVGILLASVMVMSMMACSAKPEAETTDPAPAETETGEESAGDPIPLKISHHPYIHALPSVYAEEMDFMTCLMIPLTCMQAVLYRMRPSLPVHGK